MLASGLPQSDRLSNHTYELSAHIEILARLFIHFPVPSLVLIKDNTLKKACIGNICQYIKPIIIIASNKEIIQPYTSPRTWPKALASFQSFKTIPRINLCDAKSSYSILLGIPFISKLTLRKQFKQFMYQRFHSLKGFIPCGSSYPIHINP